LKGAHDIQLQKPVKQELGGGYKIFLFDDLEFYEGVQNEEEFLTSQERQSIVRHILFSIRILQKQEINQIKFKVNQSLSNLENLQFQIKHSSFLFSTTWFRKKINSTSYSIT
jgi:hypothetical protein